jgi:hypothetical protein
MSERRTARISLMIALVGTLLMLAAAVSRLAPSASFILPTHETARPALPDWPRHSLEPIA